MDAVSSLEIRPYRSSDRSAVAEICVRTAAGGGDARGVYSDDSLMPDVYALPYVEHAPDLAFVVVDRDADGTTDPLVVDDGRLIGYVLGTPDTTAFVDWWRQEWTPSFRARHPEVGDVTAAAPGYTEEALWRDGTDPERMTRGLDPADLRTYPAHLHIDLVPEAQGRGLGRRLVRTLCDALAARGAPGVHLSYDPANTGARAFYDRLGFVELSSSTPHLPVLGLPTGRG
ncbi:GNAT family N-acetyltransferase [Isoptericola sp. b408]|uniref:GNAT family N-acetyltransferase n=1 Tax=Isoptericola sp. b408 TaxID=3064653 RepID=UPI00350F2950